MDGSAIVVCGMARGATPSAKVRLRSPAVRLRGCYLRVRLRLWMTMHRQQRPEVPVEIDLTLPMWVHGRRTQSYCADMHYEHAANFYGKIPGTWDYFGPHNLAECFRAGADSQRGYQIDDGWWVPRP